MAARHGGLAALLALALAGPAWADFEDAVDAYKRGDYEFAYRELLVLAEKGHPVAQFNLGFLYDTGRGVPQDFEEAVKWYRRAAAQGYVEAVEWRRLAAEKEQAWRPLPSGFAKVARSAMAESAPLSRAEIRELQTRLGRLGYDPGPIDGIVGPRTRGAIRAFEADAGLPVEGEATRFLADEVRAAELLRQTSRTAN